MPKKTPDEPEPAESVLYIRLSPDLTAALDKFLAAQRLKTKKQEVGTLAMMEFLEREGFWKPPHKKNGH